MGWVEKLHELDSKKAHGLDLLEKGAFEQAKRVLGEAKDLLDGWYRDQNEAIVEGLDRARARIVEKNLSMGDSSWAEGNLDAARECYKICLDLASGARERDEVLIKLGQIDQKEAPSENLEKLGQRASDNPESAEALYDFACELGMEGYLPEAIRSFEKLTRLTPDDGDVYYRLGNALLDSDRLEEARTAYERAIALEFEDKAEIHYRLGLVELAGRASHVEAKKHFKKALETRADHLECWKQLASLNRQEENYETAMECLEKALQHDPEDASTCTELGDLSESLGRKEQAVKWWTKAVEVDPEGDAAEYARERLGEVQVEEESARDTGA
jgi:tetratricopeptide (TPR) repeat protein